MLPVLYNNLPLLNANGVPAFCKDGGCCGTEVGTCQDMANAFYNGTVPTTCTLRLGTVANNYPCCETDMGGYEIDLSYDHGASVVNSLVWAAFYPDKYVCDIEVSPAFSQMSVYLRCEDDNMTFDVRVNIQDLSGGYLLMAKYLESFEAVYPFASQYVHPIESTEVSRCIVGTSDTPAHVSFQ